MNHKPVRITEVRDECNNVKTFSLDEDLKEAIPGQYVTVWIPGVAERPLSLSRTENMELTVKIFDNPDSLFTPAMFKLKEGDVIWYRGPLGNGFPIEKMKKCSVLYNFGGGFGTVPLPSLAERVGTSVMSVLGAKTSGDILFEDRLRKLGEVHVVTEDGSKGRKGIITDILNDFDFSRDGNAAICGPEKMIYYVSQAIENKIDHDKIYGSFERLMKCTYGICGGCALGHYRVCADGPVFTYQQVKDIPDFKEHYRIDRCGRKEML